ncbi:hypothetical protein BH09VER1_BH09VER1_20080 [soil metagenome]
MKKENLLLTALASIALSACAQQPTGKVLSDESSYFAEKGEHMPTTLQSVVQGNKKSSTARGKVPTNIQTPN